MTLSQADFEMLVNDIQGNKTETTYVDCKEDLSLDLEGDKASFIRDAAALANNVAESYLIIGLQDKSWTEKGIQAGSFLLDADRTQSRMNQILENKLDPQLSVRYQTINLRGNTFGVVTIRGNRAPYLIAIDDAQYGGNKTKGSPCFVNRGVVYVRHGDTTIIVNRQSRIYEIITTLNSTNSSKERNQQILDFLQRNNYSDVESSEFGRNSLTQGIVEKRWDDEAGKNIFSAANSWVSIVIFPLDKCNIDIPALKQKLQPGERIGRDGEWFHGLPTAITDMFLEANANPKGLSSKWNQSRDTNEYTQAINILPNGVIHFAATYPLFYQNKGKRFYSFVTLIGYIWQLIYLAEAIYRDAGCTTQVTLLINFSGAKGTVLADLAKGQLKSWIDIYDWQYTDNSRDISQENNIQISRELSLPDTSEDQIEILIRDIAKEIGNYYNQTTPRCFTLDTNEFPVQQFVQSNNW